MAKYAEDLAEWKRQLEEAAERARKLEEEAAAARRAAQEAAAAAAKKADEAKATAAKQGKSSATKSKKADGDGKASKSSETKKSDSPKKSGGKDSDSGGSGTCNSFVPGTKVLMADGSSKSIEDVEIGDEVVASDPQSGTTEAQPVVAQIIGEGQKNLVEITIDTDGDKGDASERLTATDGHPFWAPALNTWLKATDLTAGQLLKSSSGTWVQVTEVKRWTQQKKVRNLTVASEHTYYVLAGATPVLVHNCDTLESVAHDLGERVEGGKTKGQVVTHNGDGTVNKVGNEMISGEGSASDAINDHLMKSPDIENPRMGAPHPSRHHVETKIAWFMRTNGVTNADVVINHLGGPCQGGLSCTNAVAAILPHGSTLTVWFPNGSGGMRSVPLVGRARRP